MTVKRGPSRSLILLIRVTGPPQGLGRGPEAWIPGDEWFWGPQTLGTSVALRLPPPPPLQQSSLQIWDAKGPRFQWQ